MYYTSGYGYGNDAVRSASNAAGAGIWTIIAALLALIGGIIAYYLFVKPEKAYDSKFLMKLRDFLRFKVMMIEGILKVFYVIALIFTTLSAFSWFAMGFLGVLFFLLQITLGNVMVRVVYEAVLLKIMIWKNTKEINEKMKK